jgi:hypothetical protein
VNQSLHHSFSVFKVRQILEINDIHHAVRESYTNSLTLAISNSQLWDTLEGNSHWKQFTYCYKYMYHSGYAFTFVRIPKNQQSTGIVKAIKCR